MLRVLLLIVTFVLIMASFLPMLGLLRLCNTKREHRHWQVLVPALALITGICVITDMDLVHGFFYTILYALERIIPAATVVGSTSFPTFFVFNYLYVLFFCVMKVLLTLGTRLAASKFPNLGDALYGIWYEYDGDDDLWLLKEDYRGARHMARIIHFVTTFLACVLVIPAFFGVEGFSGLFYPSVGIVFTAELYFLLSGETRSEHTQSIEEDYDAAVRMHSYGKIILSLKERLGQYLLYDTSYALKQFPNTADFEFCEELECSSSREKQIAGRFFAELIRQGVMTNDGSGDYGCLERSAVLGAVRLMQGESVLVASPFYKDYAPYVFLAVQHTLLRNGNVVFLHGSSMDEECMQEFVRKGVCVVSSSPDMWTVAPLSADGSSRPHIATLSFAHMGNVRLLLNNEALLRDTALVVIVDAGNMLSACPTSLDVFATLVNRGTHCAFCVFNRNADGLVDALSHALRTSIVEVTATQMSLGLTIGAFWDVTGHSLDEKLLPGVSKYLGMAPQIGMVALRGQVEKVGWVGRGSVPLRDLRWILSQYYREVFDYAELPQDQEQIDRRFEFISDPCSTTKKPEQFLVVEDEYNNLFESYRQFSSRGMRESFVNVLAPDYLLRDYMVDNALVFEHDPKAIPSFVPDYPRSARNVAVSLAMRMLDGGQFLPQDEIARTLRYLGYPCAHVQDMLERLLNTYVMPYSNNMEDCAREYLVVRIERRYNEALQAMVQYKKYGLREMSHTVPCFQSLKGVELITEQPDGTTRKLATRMMGLVWQSMLPGQFVTVDGKYYEVISISSDAGVVLRRAADHFNARRSYRQLRTYELCHSSLDGAWERETSRVVRGVTMERVVLDVLVRTSGYLSLPAYNDVYHARKIHLDGVPERRYVHKESIKLVFPGFSESATRTLAVVMSEVLVTLFPNEHDYVAVLMTGCEELPEGLLHGLTLVQDEPVDSTSQTGIIYVVEDCPVDLGIVTSIERNMERILEICADYLAWVEEHESMARQSDAIDEPVEGEEPLE